MGCVTGTVLLLLSEKAANKVSLQHWVPGYPVVPAGISFPSPESYGLAECQMYLMKKMNSHLIPSELF